jgi:hypothetical protein
MYLIELIVDALIRCGLSEQNTIGELLHALRREGTKEEGTK